MINHTEPIISEKRRTIHGLGLGLDKAVVGYGIGSQSGKEANEDNYWPHEREDERYVLPKYDHIIDYLIAGRLYIVADGVSLGLSGEIASKLAVNTIAETYYDSVHRLEHYPSAFELEQLLRAAIMRANERLLAESRQQRRERELADPTSYLQTTVVCGLLRGQTLLVACVGDSRLYRLRQDKAAPRKVSLDILSGDEEKRGKSFVGSNLQANQIEILTYHDLRPQDVLMLCSDGLYNYLSFDNDPEKADAVISQTYQNYYRHTASQEEQANPNASIQRWSYELLVTADDPRRGGGGDNITVLVVEIPFRDGYPWDEQTIENLTNIAWLSPDYLVGDESQVIARERLSELCERKAQDLIVQDKVLESRHWEHRAIQLKGTSSLELDELEEADKPHADWSDFESHHAAVSKKLMLYEKAPGDQRLRTSTLDAVIRLADSASAPSSGGKAVWEAMRALLIFHAIAMQKSTEGLKRVGDTREQLVKRLAQIHLPDMKESNSLTFYELINGTHYVLSSSYADFVQVLASGQDASKMQEGSLGPASSPKKLPSDEKDGEQRALDNRADSASDAIPFFAKISLQGPFFYVICGILVVLLLIMFGMISRRSDTSPTPTSNPTSQTPTLLPTTRTAVSDIPTPTKPAEIFPDLNIVELVHNIETIPKGRDHAELTTRLSLELNGLQDADAIIELQTVLPPRLTLIPGAGFPSPEQDVLEAPVIQRIALANVDPQDIVFSTKYIVEWPHVTHPTFELTVTAKLLGANKTVLAQVEESTLPFEIDHIPELRVDQAVIPDLVTKNDPATLQLAIHNTGATYIDRLEINWGASQIDEPFSNADLWQNKLDNIVLEPGEVMTVSISTPVITNHPRSLSAWLAIKGALDDGSSVTSDGEPAHWAIYANGKVVLQDGCIDCYLRTALGSEEKVSDLDNGVLLKVLDAKKGPDENSVWYQVEYTLSNEQPTMGWVKSEYVQLPPDIEAYLQERADE